MVKTRKNSIQAPGSNGDKYSRTRKIVNAIRKGFKNTKKNVNIATMQVNNKHEVSKADELFQSPHVTFVLIKANWCGHCRDYEPKWEQLEKAPGRNAHMVKMPVELQAESQVLKNVPIDGVPTVLEVRNGVARSVDLEAANDIAAMTQEISRPSNVPMNKTTIGNNMKKASNESNEEEETSTRQEPTKNMEKLVNQLNKNKSTKNLGETNGSRVNQPALDLAASPAELIDDLPEIQDDSSLQTISQSSQSNDIIKSAESPKNVVIDMTPPEDTVDTFMEKANNIEEIMNTEAKELDALPSTPIEPPPPSIPKQRGGGNHSTRKRIGTLLPFLRRLGSPVFKKRQTRKIKRFQKKH